MLSQESLDHHVMSILNSMRIDIDNSIPNGVKRSEEFLVFPTVERMFKFESKPMVIVDSESALDLMRSFKTHWGGITILGPDTPFCPHEFPFYKNRSIRKDHFLIVSNGWMRISDFVLNRANSWPTKSSLTMMVDRNWKKNFIERTFMFAVVP